MINWLAFRIMEFVEQEQKAWRVIPLGVRRDTGTPVAWMAMDDRRHMIGPIDLGDTVCNRVITRVEFPTENSAKRYVRYRIYHAAVWHCVCFWRR